MNDYSSFAMCTSTPLSFEAAISRATELLQAEGFGVLTTIDVQATLKKKLDVDYKPFIILGACNPAFAHRTLEAVPEVSTLLPCNVVIRDEGDRREVAILEPTIMGQIINNTVVASVAAEVSQRLHRVLEGIATAR